MSGKQTWRVAVLLAIIAVAGGVMRADQPSVEELKARVERANVGDRPPLCLHIAERQLAAAVQFLTADDSEKAKAALADVVAFAELDRDYSIQAHKHEKQSEIALRKMARKLEDVKHTLVREDQDQIQQAVDRLQQIRDDLLSAMFPRGGKR